MRSTEITPQAHGYPWVPGIYAPEQIAGITRDFVQAACNRRQGLDAVQAFLDEA